MTPLALIRHGSTSWNRDSRIQGRRDVALDEAGRAAVETWRLPPEVSGFRWISSPLRRALETARILGAAPQVEPRLREMDWGEWEGRRIEDLRAELGPVMAENENRGLDFRPDGGESPRDVQDRVRPWLADVAGTGKPTVAVIHKGVIRVIFAQAVGWDMTGRPPQRLADASVHFFHLDENGAPKVHRLNVSLETG